MKIAPLALTSCATLPPAPPGEISGAPRLYQVASGIFRSGQPTGAELAALGIRSVVKLNSALEFADHAPPGVVVYREGWLPAGPVSHEEIAAALRDLEHAPRPVLIHCTHGVDRTGLLVALWRVEVQGWSPARAWAEWRAYGRDMHLVLLTRAFERETGWKP